ncbi:hypothetical protein SAMN02910369_02512 [Lachnospiraceae bacterium NE2001]|nr:hypothetical protein SAMN02910369_02512 [Lachnospiraceae bacterium NE2001]
MEKLVTKSGNVGYRYDEGERPDFDAYISRLSEFGIPKSHLYLSIYEAEAFTDNFDYDAFDKERVERLGYPIDWLRRVGLNAKNMALLHDDEIVNMCEALKAFDESVTHCHIMFEGKKNQIVNLAKRFLEENQ